MNQKPASLALRWSKTGTHDCSRVEEEEEGEEGGEVEDEVVVVVVVVRENVTDPSELSTASRFPLRTVATTAEEAAAAPATAAAGPGRWSSRVPW